MNSGEYIMENMWDGFTDFELCELAFVYGIQEKLDINFNERFKLSNRVEIEELLTIAEMDEVYSQEG
jgi:hypothetical protein